MSHRAERKRNMTRRCLSLILIGVLLNLAAGGQALARVPGKDQTPPVEKIKAKIAKLGVGEKARAQIKLRNGQTIKGYVSNAGADDFRFTDQKTGQTTTIAYADVVEVKKPGMSKLTKIVIVAGIGVVVVALIGYIDFRRNCCF
jgi:preprotein translocase subunit Sss1